MARLATRSQLPRLGGGAFASRAQAPQVVATGQLRQNCKPAKPSWQRNYTTHLRDIGLRYSPRFRFLRTRVARVFASSCYLKGYAKWGGAPRAPPRLAMAARQFWRSTAGHLQNRRNRCNKFNRLSSHAPFLPSRRTSRLSWPIVTYLLLGEKSGCGPRRCVACQFALR
jgi:hypothetical protein